MTALGKQHQEKRDFIRMKIDAPAHIHLLRELANTNAITTKTDQVSIDGSCLDLSGGGLLVELSQALSIGTKVKVNIYSNYNKQSILKALAEVTRIASPPNKKASEELTSCWLGMKIYEILK